MIDEMYPRNLFDFEKYRTYLELRKERDKFLKSLKEMNHHEWRIRKQLIEAGGLGDTVYICPARGGGRTISAERIAELLESGRDIKFVRASDICKKPSRSYGPYDHDLWDHLDSTFTQKLCEELLYQELQKDIDRLARKSVENTLKIKTLDDDVHNHRLFNDWYIYGGTINDAVIRVATPDSNPD